MEDSTKPPVVEEDPLPDDIANGTPEDIMLRVRMIQNELKVSHSSASVATFKGCHPLESSS